MPDSRLTALAHWLDSSLGLPDAALAPASADASFRRYFRVTPAVPFALAPAARTLIVMDAPPDREDCRPFVQIAQVLAKAGVAVPTVLATDLVQGFLLLSDLGTTTYLDALTPQNAQALYLDAIATLVRMQSIPTAASLPAYDQALLQRELDLFPQWYVDRHLARKLDATQNAALTQVNARLIANNLAQAKVFVHRDYHSRNLMLHAPNPGVLDFQDAVYGPITYDLVSLLRDAYIAWDEERQIDWVVRYWESARRESLPVPADFGDFWRDFEWMGVQRQLKVLGIFARLAHRDGKTGYVAEMPRVLAYLRAACGRYRDLAPLAVLLDSFDGQTPTVGYTF